MCVHMAHTRQFSQPAVSPRLDCMFQMKKSQSCDHMLPPLSWVQGRGHWHTTAGLYTYQHPELTFQDSCPPLPEGMKTDKKNEKICEELYSLLVTCSQSQLRVEPSTNYWDLLNAVLTTLLCGILSISFIESNFMLQCEKTGHKQFRMQMVPREQSWNKGGFIWN